MVVRRVEGSLNADRRWPTTYWLLGVVKAVLASAAAERMASRKGKKRRCELKEVGRENGQS